MKAKLIIGSILLIGNCLTCWGGNISGSNESIMIAQLLPSKPTVKLPIELVQYETGYYYGGCPMIITKWKNTSSADIRNTIIIKAAFFKGDEEIGQNYKYLHNSADSPFEKGISRQIPVFVDVSFSPSMWRNNNLRCKVYVNNEFYKEFPIEGKELISNRIQDKPKISTPSAKQAKEIESPRVADPRLRFPGRTEQSSTSKSSVPKNVVRFEIIGQGVVDEEQYKGYIEMDTVKKVWNVFMERGAIVGLAKWEENPYNDPNLYKDKDGVDYMIKPWVYEGNPTKYYIDFAKNEAGGSSLRISDKSASSYFPLWGKKAASNSKIQSTTSSSRYNLEGRQIISLPPPSYTVNFEGRVVITVTVDLDGKVVDAVYNSENSTTDNPDLIKASISAAKSSRFSKSENSDALQEGTITYNFKLL